MLRNALKFVIIVVYLQPKTNINIYMGNLADSLRKHFEETPQDVLDREWEELKYLNEIGPDASEYIERVKSYYGPVMQDSCKSTPVVRYPSESFQTEYKYYLAA